MLPEPWVPRLPDGNAAACGSGGCWLSDPADVAASTAAALAAACGAEQLHLRFPSNWPEAFEKPGPLRRLVNAQLRGVRCRVVAAPPAAARGAATTSLGSLCLSLSLSLLAARQTAHWTLTTSHSAPAHLNHAAALGILRRGSAAE